MSLHTDSSSSREQEKDRLLTQAAAHVLKYGFQTLSFRAMAAQLGTSHRMLSYYFGTAEAFWEALLSKLRSQQQSQLFEQNPSSTGVLSLKDVWARLTSDTQLSVFKITFQLYGQALVAPEKHQAFLDEVVTGWIDRIATGLAKQQGCSFDVARVESRLRLAVIRGLILDLLTTGDLQGTTHALHKFADLVEPR